MPVTAVSSFEPLSERLFSSISFDENLHTASPTATSKDISIRPCLPDQALSPLLSPFEPPQHPWCLGTFGRAGALKYAAHAGLARMAWHRVASHQPSTLIKGPKLKSMWPLQLEAHRGRTISHRTPDWLVAVID
ncbi:hypothetical protein BDP55DRAFT_225695 [Colletotrichum godetiae]|uniref:Uncharacterized protein n=1 Tax=Colletotrichum godetiae TaxID=1209918 RepID=A0AAJ0AHP6_9PEZI|nr:uncharacterized protein BDP55DRAFT_225695 [Colletotrichum godetiae]KAK1673475.1 hypothetical protein BDP55DRAFT_225695 [Colletotrichum godetiae]